MLETDPLSLVDGVERLVGLGLLERAEGAQGRVQLHRLLGLYVREAVGTERAGGGGRSHGLGSV